MAYGRPVSCSFTISYKDHPFSLELLTPLSKIVTFVWACYWAILFHLHAHPFGKTALCDYCGCHVDYLSFGVSLIRWCNSSDCVLSKIV